LIAKKINTVKSLPFVASVSPVAKSVKTYAEVYDYGPSERQIRLSGVKKLHEMNIIGKDVIVGIMDTGSGYLMSRL
jgi:hypothetical protein